jgi:hypothetical protein
MEFSTIKLPDGKKRIIPKDVALRVPENPSIDKKDAHFLVYLPWKEKYMEAVPSKYVEFFKNVVLPNTNVRSTNVHVALCMPFVKRLAKDTKARLDMDVVYVAFMLHDIGWSSMDEKEIAASLDVKGLSLNGKAVEPKKKHAILGAAMASEVLRSWKFKKDLSETQKDAIIDAVLLHDRPEELSSREAFSDELKMVADVDHLWSFVHENFWLDTIRKDVEPPDYANELEKDLDGYFVTAIGRRFARKLLEKRMKEVEELKRGRHILSYSDSNSG